MKIDILQYAGRLEFDKILNRVSALAVSDDGKLAVLETLPRTELYEAASALDITDALFVLLSKNGSPSIASVSGIPEIAMRADKGGVLSMGELLRVRTMLRNARNLRAWYAGGAGGEAADPLFYMLCEDSALERRIADSILSESEMSDDASPALSDIRRRIHRAELSIREKLDSMVRSTTTQKYLQDAIVTMRGGRFVLPVKQEHRGDVKGLVHDVSASGSTYFVEPAAVVEANNRIMQLRGEELAEIERILSVFSADIAAIAGTLRQSYEYFIEIDAALARARYAISISGSRPRLNDQGHIHLKRARHPLIPKQQVVPVDVALGDTYNTLVITGPNTGGKTVTLKTVGLLTLMAMAGMLIPAAENSELSVFEQVLVDIGDEQSIEQSLSTFSGHIKNTAAILETADDRSLVLLDELGAGTDPAEGAALATAILERLGACGSRVIATTHYGELKLFALETPGVQNASCEFDVATLRPTYRLNIGIPGRSNALLIGEKLGLDSALLESARRHMSAEDRRFEEVLDEIEQLKSDLSAREQEIETIRRQADQLKADAQAEYNKLVAEGQREMDAAKLRARQMAHDVTANANKLLDEIKKIELDKSRDNQAARQRARAIANTESSRLHDMAGAELDNAADTLEPLGSVAAGDTVYIVALASTGEALGGADAKGLVEVKTGNIKTRVHISDLRRPKAVSKPVKKPISPTSGAAASVNEKRSGRTEVNLLGMTVDEAIMEAERFLDNALLSHIDTVYLIHGKGTGALRGGIHRYLKTNKHVKQFRLGSYGEGESGVTVVELK